MIFRDQQSDEALHRELLNNEVYSLSEFARLQLPEEGSLMDALVDNAEAIDGGRYSVWLIQRHNCTRFASLSPNFDWLHTLQFDVKTSNALAAKDVYPLELWHGAAMVAICRPDAKPLLESIRQASRGAQKVFCVAASPMDVRFLRQSFSEHRIY